jgi:hypothetical protein
MSLKKLKASIFREQPPCGVWKNFTAVFVAACHITPASATAKKQNEERATLFLVRVEFAGL